MLEFVSQISETFVVPRAFAFAQWTPTFRELLTVSDFALSSAYIAIAILIFLYGSGQEKLRWGVIRWDLLGFVAAAGLSQFAGAAERWFPLAVILPATLKLLAAALAWRVVAVLLKGAASAEVLSADSVDETRLQAEIAARRTAETRLIQILQSLRDGVAIADASGRLEFINDAGTRIMGGTMDEMQSFSTPGKYRFFRSDGVTELIPEEMPLAYAIRGHFVDGMEIVVRRPNRPDLITWGHANPILDVSGGLVGGVVVFHDVTRARRMEEEEARYYKKLGKLTTIATQSSQILDHSGESIHRMLLHMIMNATDSPYACLAVTNYGGDVSFYSPQTTTGATSGTVMELDTIDIAGADIPYEVHELLAGNVAGVNNELHSVPVTSVVVTGSMNAAIVHRGSHIGWLLVGDRDLAYSEDDADTLQRAAAILAPTLAARIQLEGEALERSRVESQLRERQQQLEHLSRTSTLGELTTGLAHELNQPLTAIANFAEASERRLANSDCPDAEKVITNLQRIRKLTHRSGEVMKRIRKIATPRRGNSVHTDVCELIRDTIDLLFAKSETQHKSIHELHSGGPLWADVDPVEIQQVLMNLIRNAIDATEDCVERRIEIFSEENVDREAVVRVSDNGSGIAEDDPMKLFEPWYTNKHEGLGIGLKICHTIIERHGGRLTAKNNAEGGATFQFTVPLIEANILEANTSRIDG